MACEFSGFLSVGQSEEITPSISKNLFGTLVFFVDQIYCARGTVAMLHITYSLIWA